MPRKKANVKTSKSVAIACQGERPQEKRNLPALLTLDLQSPELR